MPAFWVRSSDQISEITNFKGDPSKLLRISVSDTPMQYQFPTKSHSTAIDTPADLFKSTPLMVSLGDLECKIRPKSLSMEEPGYDIDATGYRKFFALPGKEWIWARDIADFDLRSISVGMSHTGDFGKPNQACNAFEKKSEMKALDNGRVLDCKTFTKRSR